MVNPAHLKILRQGSELWNNWRNGNLTLLGLDLSQADLRKAILRGADLRKVDLSEANLSGADLYRADLRDADLSGADLNKADLGDADLRGTLFSNGDLRGAHLRGADLSRAIVRGTILCGANLTGVDLRNADLSRADLSGVDISHGDLSGADLSGTDFSGAQVGWTRLADVDLSTVKGLETIRHYGPSTIGIDTFYRSRDKIPEVFLRGAGVPDTFITYARALTAQSIEFYSCFISYSGTNQDFADRLYTDLQNKGVRCWFAPEDLKIGDKTRDAIDESIRLYDKLLLILSEQSVSSQWVEHEVEAALEREARENRLVLFPVRLDDSVMETNKAWAANIRRTRNVGDFRHWKSHDDYQKALARILRDLKAVTDAK